MIAIFIRFRTELGKIGRFVPGLFLLAFTGWHNFDDVGLINGISRAASARKLIGTVSYLFGRKEFGIVVIYLCRARAALGRGLLSVV
jgi:hypothetical protein